MPAAKKPADHRPPLGGKTSTTTKKARESMLDTGYKFTVDGKEHGVTMGDLSALDVRDLRQATGMGFAQMLGLLVSDASDVDIFAAALWLARRVNNGERTLRFEDVLAEMDYAKFEEIQNSQEQVNESEPAMEDAEASPEG